MALLIENLHVSVEDKEILSGVNLSLGEGEVHALMGPNGNGKSTLLATVMGNPNYTVTEGSVTYNGEDLLALPVNERAKKGIFLGMQYPPAIPGVTNSDFFRAAIHAKEGKPVSLYSFIKQMDKATKDLQLKPDLAHRFLNEGFSGGEKKRNEIVQMMLLKPDLAMLDEIDSGLDVDALKLVADAINEMRRNNPKLTLIVVSHYERFLELVVPTHTHVLVNGKIVVEGGPELTRRIDEEGYKWIEKEYNVTLDEEEPVKAPVSLGSCAVKQTRG